MSQTSSHAQVLVLCAALAHVLALTNRGFQIPLPNQAPGSFGLFEERGGHVFDDSYVVAVVAFKRLSLSQLRHSHGVSHTEQNNPHRVTHHLHLCSKARLHFVLGD